ncbi:DUF4132 domain-containing protein [Streptomyces sp. NRRL F-5123]|uniref:DUF4132 domain-containing protein n=1 Tax=Streptomyces sp. NRRL F-5123 TaxID=1463856 RepID=UPI0006933362|nr:DUF4132 domain-containing protein [Streptomyces sp. NRRL F-5123]
MAILLAARLDAAVGQDDREGVHGREFADTKVGRLVLRLPEPEQRRAALHLHQELCLVVRRRPGEQPVRALAELPLRWTADQAEELVGRVIGRLPRVWTRTYGMLALPVAAVESLGPDEQVALRADVAQLARWLPLVDTSQGERSRLHRRMDALLLPEGSGLHWSVLDDDDAYGPRMRAEHAGLLASPGVAELLVHCVTLEQVRAGMRWRKRAAELVGAAPRGAEAVRALVAGFADQPEGRAVMRWAYGDVGRPRGLTGRANTCLVRGLLWVLADLATAGAGPAGEEAVRLVAGCARNAGTGIGGKGGDSRNEQVANTAVAVLGGFDGGLAASAVGELASLRAAVRHQGVLKKAERAQREMAARSGLAPSQLRERAVPTAGLDGEHRREVALPDGSTAVLAVDGAGRASLAFVTAAGRRVVAPPASAKREAAGEVARMREELKALRKLLAAERLRLEELLASGASWSGAEWQSCYADHPVVGAQAKALLWEVCPAEAGEDGWRAGLPERAGAGWVLAAADGTAVPVGAADRVRLWHPLRAEVAEVAAWRTEVTGRELRQPFKQVFREIYPLTPAEEATGGYSNRFAAQVLRFGQARSLMAARGWSATHLGFWDSGYEGEAVRVVPAAGPVEWRARFDYQLVEETRTLSGLGELCSTNRVRFERQAAGGRAWVPVALVEVPPLVLSEALRDVDLFVGVASIAGDPDWRDAAEGRLAARWHEAAFGELPPSAEMRKEALARLLPRTRIADRVELAGRFLRVRGDRAAYRIHLGSGNVLVEPHDAYLCIVPARQQGAAGRVFLPFEEDGGMLAVVLSKAFLLADDASITDPTITRQLPPVAAKAAVSGG